MKLSKAILASICILPLATIAYAEDINTQNLRISETSMMSVNEATPSSMQQKEAMQISNHSSAINNSNDVEVDKEEGFRWPWQRRKDKALEAIEDFKNQSRP
ncbi:hypothetical protein IPZ60_11295 [Psychrobacter sp. NG25]|uniref:hypothetical protein n=1 Tax=Psychrobacter sp. NG25 TaxID=2782005 RepID=UPI00188360E7|nr:hypothetical protein [Psychrobacter sp. NG25]MBF0659325.1 hypothetical protein [Psychrobacter sp. NG25]